MPASERMAAWNRWYDTMPAEWRFQFVLWPLLGVGTVNMFLTVATGFPFALLVLLSIIFIAAVRVPYVVGWVGAPTHVDTGPTFQIQGANWLIGLNQWYEALSESRRFWIYPTVLLIGGAINMLLTIHFGFPFGLLFLLVLLALVVVRAPYTAGWLRPSTPTPPTEPVAPPVTHDQPPPADEPSINP
jgi:hypothetical protein